MLTLPDFVDKCLETLCHDLIPLHRCRVRVLWIELFRLDSEMIQRQLKQVQRGDS